MGSADSEPRRGGRRPVIIAVLVLVVLVAGGVFAVRAVSQDGRERPTAAHGSSSTGGGTPAASSRAPSTQPVPPSGTGNPQPRALGHGAANQQQPTQFDQWVNRLSRWLDIPSRALRGYAKATMSLNKSEPGCHLSWVTLAGIGKQATNNGASGGGLNPDGTPKSPIDNVELRDFFDHVVSDSTASGPMQLPAELWEEYGSGNRQNIDDAALATGKALCAGGADLSNGTAWWDAVSRINDAPLFLHRVLATATVYGTVSQRSTPPKPQPLHAVEFAISKIGLPYVWGGNGTSGFDCSGLTTAAYAAQGIHLPRKADWQYRALPKAPKNQLPQLGDLVFFGNPATTIHHVGIYIGNQEMIDAPTFGEAVQVHRYTEPGDYAGAGRPVR